MSVRAETAHNKKKPGDAAGLNSTKQPTAQKYLQCREPSRSYQQRLPVVRENFGPPNRAGLPDEYPAQSPERIITDITTLSSATA